MPTQTPMQSRKDKYSHSQVLWSQIYNRDPKSRCSALNQIEPNYKSIMLFFEFATTLADLLFIEPMLHLSHVKQMCCQTTSLLHEMIICIEIIRRRLDYHRDSSVKNPCWRQQLNPLPSNPDSYSLCSCSFFAGFGQLVGHFCMASTLGSNSIIPEADPVKKIYA